MPLNTPFAAVAVPVDSAVVLMEIEFASNEAFFPLDELTPED